MTTQKIIGWRNRPAVKAYSAKDPALLTRKAAAKLGRVPSLASINTQTAAKQKPASGLFASV